MAHRPYVPWPHAALRKAAAPVAEINDEVRAIWDEMIVAVANVLGAQPEGA